MVGGWEKPKLIYLSNLPQDSNLGGKPRKKKNCLKQLGQAFIGKTSFFCFLILVT